MRDNVLVRGLKRMARFLYEHCDQIVTVGEGLFGGGIACCRLRHSPPSGCGVIRNSIDTSLFVRRGRATNEVFRAGVRLGRAPSVILYAGTLGMGARSAAGT